MSNDKDKKAETEAEKQAREVLEREAAEAEQEIKPGGLAKIRGRTRAAERGDGKPKKEGK